MSFRWAISHSEFDALAQPTPGQPVLLSAFFSVRDPFHGALSFKANNDKQLVLSVIHERADGMIASYDLAGDDTLIAIDIRDAEALIVLARRSGGIVGAGIFEIDTALVDVGALLVPRVLSNLIFSQEAAPASRVSAPLTETVEAEVRP